MSDVRSISPSRSIVARVLGACLALALAVVGLVATPASAADTSFSMKGNGYFASENLYLASGTYQFDLSFSGNTGGDRFTSWVFHEDSSNSPLVVSDAPAGSARHLMQLDADLAFSFYIDAPDHVSWEASITQLTSPSAKLSHSLSGTGLNDSSLFTVSPGVYRFRMSYSGNSTADGAAPFALQLTCTEGETTTLWSDYADKGSMTDWLVDDVTSTCWISANSANNAKWTVKIDGALTSTPTPRIDGSPTVGSKLVAVPGTWKPSGVKLSYQWLRDGKAIAGATKSSYTLTASDKGKKISIKVTGSKPDHETVSMTSRKTAKIADPRKFYSAPTPTISGTAKVGKKLAAKAGTWKPYGSKVSYQWLRSGKEIKGATKSTYTLTKSDKGKTITVKVTGSRPGYKTTSKTSKATSKVK